MISIILELVKDIFRGFGMAYYGFTSELGYFERGLLILLLYSTFGIWVHGMDLKKGYDWTISLWNLVMNFFK